MEPLVLPDAIALLDRHYNSLMPYRPNRPNLYAVRHGSHLRCAMWIFSPTGWSCARTTSPSQWT